MNISMLNRVVLNSKDNCVEWCQRRNLLPLQKACTICQEQMLFDINQGVSGRWRCKKRSLHRALNRRVLEIAVADGTWFSNTKLSIEQSLLMTYCWSQGFTYAQTIQECRFEEDEHVCEETVSDWYSYCREVCILALDMLYERQGRIGGRGH